VAAGDRVCTSNLQYVTSGLPVRVEGDPEPDRSEGEKGGDK
jgi:hypothetical protein